MRNVKVLLRENVKNLGTLGDVVTVAPGYARNYLLPSRVAVEATPDNIKMMERRRARYDQEMAKHSAEVDARVAALSGLELSTTEKADETGTLYGSVSAAVVARLMGEKGFEVEEKNVRLDEPIKSVGEHQVPVHVHGDSFANVKVTVTAEEG